MAFYNEHLLKNPKLYKPFVVNDVFFKEDDYYKDGLLAMVKENKSESLASVRLYQVPMCCGILFMADVKSSGRYKGKRGLGQHAIRLAIRAAELGKYSILQGIVAIDNTTWKRCGLQSKPLESFLKNGFEVLETDPPINSRTGNRLLTIRKHINLMKLDYLEDNPNNFKSANLKEI